jgi:hypothetical protein
MVLDDTSTILFYDKIPMCMHVLDKHGVVFFLVLSFVHTDP